MKSKTDLLIPGGFYHIYNRANGSERLFRSDENYRYFLRRYSNFIAPIVNTYCYCLMPNHFHFLIEVKEEAELEAFFADLELKKREKLELDVSAVPPPKFEILEEVQLLISKQFSKLFSSYTQAFNKEQDRMGSLFMKSFKRLPITDEQYRLNLVRYIHQNPVEACLCLHPEDWEHSSYSRVMDGHSSLVDTQAVINWFGDQENFKFCHQSVYDFQILF